MFVVYYCAFFNNMEIVRVVKMFYRILKIHLSRKIERLVRRRIITDYEYGIW